MSIALKDIVMMMQLVILRLIYDNFTTIVEAAHREIVSKSKNYVNIINFGSNYGKLRVVMRRDKKSRYYMDFFNVPFPLGVRDFTIDLGRGRKLVNHRVLNDIGVRLNAFLDDGEHRKNKSGLMKFGLEFASKHVSIAALGWFTRLFGAEQTNFQDEMDKVNLPGLHLNHETKWERLKHKTSISIEVKLMGGVSETIYAI